MNWCITASTFCCPESVVLIPRIPRNFRENPVLCHNMGIAFKQSERITLTP
jgi:hypothetical protein